MTLNETRASCLYRLFKENIGKLYISGNLVDLSNMFGLSREAKQNATSCVIFMLCCRNCAVHYKLDARFPTNVTIFG